MVMTFCLELVNEFLPEVNKKILYWFYINKLITGLNEYIRDEIKKYIKSDLMEYTYLQYGILKINPIFVNTFYTQIAKQILVLKNRISYETIGYKNEYLI